MSQYDFGTIDPITTSGTTLAGMLNQYRDAVNSGHFGGFRPPYAVKGTLWVKDVSASVSELYYFDGTDDILLATINPTTNTATPASSGTYIPTLTNITNVSSSTALSCFWSRNGNVVTLGLSVGVQPTAAADTVTELDISVPFSVSTSTFRNSCGVSFSSNEEQTGSVYQAGGKLRLSFKAKSTTSRTHQACVIYLIG